MNFVTSIPGDDPLVVEGYFAAPPAKVFKAWTDPAIVVKWFHEPNSLHSASIDLRPGGAWRFELSRDADKSVGFEGLYEEIRRDERLVFSWAQVVVHSDGNRDETPTSRIEVTFTAQGEGTAIRLVHSAISTEQARRFISGGWESSFGSLAGALLETEDGVR